MTRIIVLPDDGEWVLVPKVATKRMAQDGATNLARDGDTGPYEAIGRAVDAWGFMLAAAPPCKVVELPAAPAHLEHNEVKAWYACLDDIERRAKTLA